MKTLNDFLVLLFPIWQLEERQINPMRVFNMTPKEQYKLAKELENLPREKKLTTNRYDEEVEIGAEVYELMALQDVLNDDDTLEQLKNYYVVFVDRKEAEG